jgi:hypothetical protein
MVKPTNDIEVVDQIKSSVYIGLYIHYFGCGVDGRQDLYEHTYMPGIKNNHLISTRNTVVFI